MIQNEHNISGDISLDGGISGSLGAILGSISGGIIPAPIDMSHVHYDTKANWDRQTFLIAERGHLYIYKDAEVTYINGRRVVYPGIKIGDGSSYLIDMSYSLVGSDHEKLINHIQNSAIHVGTGDRMNWNDKVSVSVVQSNEELKFLK